jgi:hypothetical protein
VQGRTGQKGFRQGPLTSLEMEVAMETEMEMPLTSPLPTAAQRQR